MPAHKVQFQMKTANESALPGVTRTNVALRAFFRPKPYWRHEMANKFKPKLLKPTNRSEFFMKFHALFNNRDHVANVWVDGGHLCIDLDGTANFWGHADMKMPVEREKVQIIKSLIKDLWNKVQLNIPPSKVSLSQIFDGLAVTP